MRRDAKRDRDDVSTFIISFIFYLLVTIRRDRTNIVVRCYRGNGHKPETCPQDALDRAHIFAGRCVTRTSLEAIAIFQ
jgi:hypothetical protein